MNWSVLLLAILVGGFIAGLVTRLLRERRPHWSRARRVIVGALATPAALGLLTIVGVIWAHVTLPDGGEGGRDIASFILILVGTVFGVATLVGGLIGAIIAERARA